MYSDNGVIMITGISGMNPNLFGKRITITDGGEIKFCFDIKDIIRMNECVRHECKKFGIDYDEYEQEMFE